ncbi:MAG: S8 family serine peptidase [Prolixibacteraceae bacterium]|nr:S8 family serine peptidase [Prolixibacteraceae bacterium]
MRTSIIIGLLVFIFSFPAHSQDVFVYDRNGAKEYFERIDSIVQIKFKDGTGNNEKLAVVQSVNSKVNYSGISIEKRICIPVDKNNLPDYNKLKSDSSVVYANQSLQYGDGTIQIPTEKILARVKEGYKIKEVLDKLNIEYENFRRIGHNQNSYLIILKNGESVETANLLYESGCFEHAQPTFARLMTSLKTYYTDQWGLNNTGQNGGTAGIDINAPEAWQITEGCDDIVVAVLDQGVDLDHPDLAGNLLTGYDATDGSDGAVNGDCSGNYAHGTCCAGIIAAIDNTIGIKGVAPNCRIIPVRVMENNFVSYDDDATEGMNYA